MRTPRLFAAVAGASLLVTALGAVPATAEDPAPPGPGVKSAPEARTPGSLTARAARAAAAEEEPEGALAMPRSYPVQPKLHVYPQPDRDAADLADLTGYDDIAPRLQAAMRTSDRVSTQIVGESTEGRQLYLVTVTAPEEQDETSQQTAWRKKIRTAPEAAAADAALKKGYKTPVWITANIHGNEWEGTDAALDYIEQLASAPWNDVKGLLRGHRLYFTVVLNPDGRTLGQRPTALNLDENRDMITNTTPESTSFVRTAHAVQALYAADFHGYTGVLQVEPCGPPHGDDYEYDLFIPHGYAAALQIEKDVVDARIPGNTYYNVVTGDVVDENTGPDTAHIAIPYRDTPTGWDDYPPIFTAQYAAFTGAVTSTVELPISRPNSSSQSPANAVVNRAVALRTMQSLVDYVADHDAAMLADQVEFFRRANVGQERVALTEANIAAVPGPDQWKPLWDASDDQVPVQYPRAFVIPMGADQRSVSDARFLVSRLLLHDIAVRRLNAAATWDGTRYPAGSYVVDMHQPKRNLAHSLLATGSDISNHPGILAMYDVSAWSWGRLWGADVAAVGTTGVGSLPASTDVVSAEKDGSVPRDASHLTFELAGVDDFRALNLLIGEYGVSASLLADGSAILAAGEKTRLAVEAAAAEFDVDFTRATAAELAELSDAATKGLREPRIAYAGNQDDLLSLTHLGFYDLRRVDAVALTSDPDALDGVDVLWLGAGLNFTGAQAAGRAAVQEFVDGGGDIVGRSANAFNTAKAFGAIDGTAVTGNGAGNGIVAVDTAADGVLAPYAQSHAFVYPAAWFTDLPASVKTEQTYATGNPLVAGHWRDTTGTDGPASAAGRAAAVSASTPEGTNAFIFGTAPFFRTHTKGGQSQAARAIFWAAPEGRRVPAPISTTTTLKVPGSVTYPRSINARVTVRAARGTPEGRVEIREGSRVLATRDLGPSGSVTVRVARLRPGSHALRAVFVPTEGTAFLNSTSAASTVKVAKAASRTTVKAKALGQGKVRVAVTVKSGAGTPTGTVRVKVGSKTRLVKLRNGRATVTIKVAKGKRSVTARYAGSSLLKPSAKGVTVRVR
ncbi:Ig-like domain repeat protein [Aeromicrobium senzhongii]|uniref:Ig-like domain repeat protein n=1 Tax=Aeromicrobium senzhongii TaxID=2663859 RepID=A0ABX6SV31_9ACTN|nr:M14 family metallopeptidase [Aeromicrobium senzhongii]MTB88571.1 peptidase M14 [Aeromicrobium senzhongii]QNL94115.1 Ig-like domain repeat protein [Aeromicrobium senzhongii]